MKPTLARIRTFRKVVYDYFDAHGRSDLPWRRGKITPYTTFVSEVMLQQTQVPRVAEKYVAWMHLFPTWKKLAAAEFKDVLAVWAGMGYNRRAKWLHDAAKIVVERYRGRLPSDPTELLKFPGIGPNTAASIAAFGFDAPTVFIETNIRAVFIHHFFADRDDVGDDELQPLIEATLDRVSPHRWYSALMDYGTHLKALHKNPARKSKHHVRQTKFEGSGRQLRGKILKILIAGSQTADALIRLTQATIAIEPVLAAMEGEGLIARDDKLWRIR